MKKNLMLFVIAFIITIAFCMPSQAVIFIDSINFSGDGEYNGRTYQKISGNLFSTPFSYSHVLDEILPGSILNSASLSITHIKNSGIFSWNPEIWLLTGEDFYLGILSNSSHDKWVTNTFLLNENVLAHITDTNPWNMEVKLWDLTLLTNQIWLDKSELRVDYTPSPSPVPEPGSMILFGSGLIGMISFIRRKKTGLIS